MTSGARILLGAVLGGVLHCVIGVLSFLLVSVFADGAAHLGETLAYALGFSIVTSPGGAAMGALAAGLSGRLGVGPVAGIGAGIGLLAGLGIAATLVSMSRGNVVMGAIAVVLAAGGGGLLTGIVGAVTARKPVS